MEKKILIVKSSSLGDILQSFVVVEYLHERFADAKIDWIVEKKYEDLVLAHPYVHATYGVDVKGGFSKIFPFLRTMARVRQTSYDWIFDLQGNCKSALFTLLSRGKKKIGLGRKSVREWPNLLVTEERIDPEAKKNMRLQYLQIVQQFLKDDLPFVSKGVVLKVSHEKEREYCEKLLEKKSAYRILVSPSSRWENKKVAPALWQGLLEKMREEFDPLFFFVWGNQEEKNEVSQLASFFPRSVVVEKLSLPALQMLLSKMDLFLGVDSAALHLSATLPQMATFSFFGPTTFSIFQPIGESHLSFQGLCPFGCSFVKSCPHLRTCATGGCLKNISKEQIEAVFLQCKKLLLKM